MNMARDKWEIEEDFRAVKRAIEVFKDKDRLADVQEHIKNQKENKQAMDAVADGNIKEALGL
jgi:hypothetical protein